MFERVMGLDVIDAQEYQRYREGMLPILTGYGGAFGYDFKVSEVLLSKTDNNINRVFTIEFPSKDVMESFFSDPEYIAVQNKHLKNSIQSKTVISMHEKNI
ncbi:MAG: DUF1330 domain-containing protein [Gammaproteobacteria bacterium]|nr:DUF1330 domain-containing protein [Gammaproteobacteria bacterium]